MSDIVGNAMNASNEGSDCFGYVYVMTDGPRGKARHYKIGLSSSVSRRKKELSSQTSASEEFQIVIAWLFPSYEDAKKAEKLVKDKLEAKGLRLRKRFEFFHIENLHVVKDCIEQAARELGCRTYPVTADALSVIRSLPQAFCTPHDLIRCLPREQRAAYFHGAHDLLTIICAMSLESISSRSLQCLANDLTINRDTVLSSDTPSLLSTVLGHFRNDERLDVRVAAERALEMIRDSERSELHSYLQQEH